MKKLIAIMMISIFCLSGCGNDKNAMNIADSQIYEAATEELSKIETEEVLPTVPKTEEIVPTETETEEIVMTETETEEQTTEAETEGENEQNESMRELSLKDITWEDFYSGNRENTILHFLFDDGTVAEENFSGPSIVEKIDYMDITGDGKNEVLLYIYWANTATEYTFIYFYEIEQGTVTDISPDTDIDELKHDAWRMTFTDREAEGYTSPIIEMISFGKEHMETYIKETVFVGYKEGKWEIIERITYVHDN